MKKAATPKLILRIANNVLMELLIVLGLFIGYTMLPIQNNFQFLAVMSGSMEPTITTGSLILIKPKAQYALGDIISFHPKTDESIIVTHRIVRQVNKGADVFYETRGDANNGSDRQLIGTDQVIGASLFAIPWIGYVLKFIRTLPGLIIIIVIPATLIIYEELKKIRRESALIIEKRRARKPAAQEEVCATQEA